MKDKSDQEECTDIGKTPTVAELIELSHQNYLEILEMRKHSQEQAAEIREQMKETDRRMKQLQDLFTTQWGKLVEALARPACLKLFSDLGIGITQVYNGPRKGKYFCNEMEIDVILCNTTVAVAVEVKTTCKIEHIDHFLQQMEHFKETFHPFANYTVYPAVAALKYDEGSDVYASKKGMFVLHANGEDMFDLVEPKVRKEY